MTIKFLADHCFDHNIVDGIIRRDPHIDILIAEKAGFKDWSDPMVLGFAARENRLLLTHDKRTMPDHFAAFTATQESAVVLIVKWTCPIGMAIEYIRLIAGETQAEEWRNRLDIFP